MRSLALGVLLLVAAPAQAADEYWPGDNLLACLMSKASVEMRHGASASAALDLVSRKCIDETAEPEPSEEPEGESGDYLDYVYSIAVRSLEAMEAAQVF